MRHAIAVSVILLTIASAELGGAKIHRPGTLIGKALEPLDKGRGDILVRLLLQ